MTNRIKICKKISIFKCKEKGKKIKLASQIAIIIFFTFLIHKIINIVAPNIVQNHDLQIAYIFNIYNFIFAFKLLKSLLLLFCFTKGLRMYDKKSLKKRISGKSLKLRK